MTGLRTLILGSLADATTAYLVLLGGGALVLTELLRPRRGLTGIPGAVVIVLAGYSLGNQPRTWHGLLVIGLSISLVLSSLRSSSLLAPLLSGAGVAVGSALLFAGENKIHAGAATLGGLFALTCHWLLRVAYRARAGKRADC